MADMHEMNYVVGRGRLFFGQFARNTRKANGQLYFGNTPELSLAQDEDTLDHYSSEAGVRVKDASATLQQDSSGSFNVDDISNNNLALWFRGEILRRIEAGSAVATGTVTLSTTGPVDGDTVTIGGKALTFNAAAAGSMSVAIGNTLGATAANLANAINNLKAALGVTATANAGVVTVRSAAAGTGGNAITLAKTGDNIAVSGAALAGGADTTEPLEIYKGRWFQLGRTEDTPFGVRNVGTVTIEGLEAEHFTVEQATGRVYVNSDAPIADGAIVDASYGVTATVEDIVIAKGENIEGEMQFIADNAHGKNKDYFWPYVRITPDGDFSLKGDDWQNMTFNFEILKRDAVTERQYITAR